MKYCNSCQIQKPFTEFYAKLGTCKTCQLDKIRIYRAQNPHIARNAAKKWANKVRKIRLQTDELYNFTHRIRNLTKNSIRKSGYSKDSKTFSILGVSYEALLEYLWTNFEKNYGISRNGVSLKELHIDHIIPISSANSKEDVLKLSHFSNLQFLFAKDNLSKGARL